MESAYAGTASRASNSTKNATRRDFIDGSPGFKLHLNRWRPLRQERNQFTDFPGRKELHDRASYAQLTCQVGGLRRFVIESLTASFSTGDGNHYRKKMQQNGTFE